MNKAISQWSRKKNSTAEKKGNLHLNCDAKQCLYYSMNDCSRIQTYTHIYMYTCCSSHNVYLYSLVQPSNIINFQFCTGGDDERVCTQGSTLKSVRHCFCNFMYRWMNAMSLVHVMSYTLMYSDKFTLK